MNDPLIKTIRVRCPPAHAFEVFVQRIDSWWPQGHRKTVDGTLEIEARVGGAFFETGPSGDRTELGEVLRYEPPRRLTYTWWPGALDRPTHVDVQFEPDPVGTLVVVTHSEGESGLGERWSERVLRFTKGWDAVLPAFVAAFDEH